MCISLSSNLALNLKPILHGMENMEKKYEGFLRTTPPTADINFSI